MIDKKPTNVEGHHRREHACPHRRQPAVGRFEGEGGPELAGDRITRVLFGELRPHLAKHGIRLSDSQIWRLITGRPERLNLQVLAVLCELLNCTPNDLITIRQAQSAPQLDKAATGDRGIAGLTPAKARIRQTPDDRRA